MLGKNRDYVTTWARCDLHLDETTVLENSIVSAREELDEMIRSRDKLKRQRDSLVLERDKLVYRVSVLERQLYASLHSSNEKPAR
jgi:hypothetical protein